MRKLLALLLFVPSLCLAQLPAYVATDELVAWYPLDGNADDLWNEMDGVVYGALPGVGPSGSTCLEFDGIDDYVEVPTNDILESIESELTLSCWFTKANSTNSHLVVKRNFVGNPNGERHHFELSIKTETSNDRAFLFSSYDNSDLANHNCQVTTPDEAFNFDVWTHIAVTFDNGLVTFYVDGFPTHQHDCGFQQLPPNNHWLNFARMHRSGGVPFSGELEGGMQNVGIWSRALEEEEIFALYSEAAPSAGCTDPEACNYDAEALIDDASCIPSGCLDETACNFNAEASCAGGECEYDADLLDCGTFGFEVDSLLACMGEEIEVNAPEIPNAPPGSGSAELIGSFSLDFGGPSQYSLGPQAAGQYEITVSGTWCGGSCWNGHTSDAAYSFNHPYGNGINPLGGNSFTISEYCPQDDNSCALIRPEPDEYNPDHVYTYYFDHSGGALVVYGLADECCWSDNQAGLDFSVSRLPTSPCTLDYTWSTGATSASIITQPVASSYVSVTVSSSLETCTDSLWIDVIDSGCADPVACNYDASDLCTAACIYPLLGASDCEEGCLACGAGTIWDHALQQCVAIELVPDTIVIAPEACAPSCGEGTVWDPINEECVIAIPADLNYDGCVTVNDLLVLLAVHGTCPPYPEWPDEPSSNTWTCGDSALFDNYWYETVLIGDQCWFAENLRTTVYADGSAIPEVTCNTAWEGLSTGARCDYDNDASNVATYGRMYNCFAATDAAGLCPTGWHVPTDDEWTELETYLGANGHSGAEGTALKSTSGWPAGNGTDDFGFSALPGGLRSNYGGSFFNAGFIGYWWSSSLSGGIAWNRYLFYYDPDIYRSNTNPRNGFSARCLRDAE